MAFSRRRFIGRCFLAFCTLTARLGGTTPATDPAGLEAALFAWMEVLLPTDNSSPGAGRLGVHRELIDEAKRRRQSMQLLKFGVNWANTEARKLGAKDFSDISYEQAREIVSKAESMGQQTIAGLFFDHTLRDGKQFYYAHKEAWGGIGFPHTPQPMGFMDYTEAPKR